MEPAEQIEADARARQAPMEAALRGGGGGSAVREYYRGATVLLTGGSGFIGKQLIEKLFRSCDIKKMYLLTRAKKGRTIHERVQQMLKDPVFDLLREKQPQFSARIEPVEGDVADIRLGIHDQHWNTLTQEVNMIFHVAATVRFDEPLRLATLTNVRGTREVLALARHCTNFKKLVHVSTAFVHATTERVNTELLEKFYPCPISPTTMIQLAETFEPSRLDGITPGLIQSWPNTYAFTKALAEDLIRTSAGDLPVCIVRPSIVLPAYYEPSPGWLDITTVMGPTGIYLGAGLGVIHIFCADVDSHLAVSPVDYVNNAVIAAAWDSRRVDKPTDKVDKPTDRVDKLTDSVDKSTDIPIYTIRRNMRHGDVNETAHENRDRLALTSAVWKARFFETSSRPLYLVLSVLLHYIPAYLLDLACTLLGRKPKGVTSFVDIYRKLDKLGSVYNYFMHNEWDFKDTNLQAMIARMSEQDRAIFNCDVTTIDMYEYILVWAVGLRKYITKDGLGNNKKAVRKQRIFSILTYIVLPLYAYVLWTLCRTVCVLVMYVFNIKNIVPSF